MVHTRDGILLSHKQNDIMPFAATGMDLEIIMLSEVHQKEKNKYHALTHIHGIYKNGTNASICI